MTHLLTPLGLVLAVAIAAFLALFLVARRVSNFGLVDIAWAGGFAPAVVYLAVQGRGDEQHRLLIAGMMGAWSLRLAFMLGRRVLGHHPVEDGRYAQLRRDWAGQVDRKMALFYVAQAGLLAGLVAPVALLTDAWRPGLTGWDWAALVVWAAGLGGETLADAQLAAFKCEPANAGQVCDRGLWRYSRHPNYFCEWLVWVGFALAITPVPLGWIAWSGPLLMGYFLLCVTGVRYTEAQLLRSKGEAYRAYQRRTSAFIPWPPRRA